VSKSKINLLEALLSGKVRFDVNSFSEVEIEQFLNYYQLVLKWNSRLHLTTLSDPESFFERHLRESDSAESMLLPEVNQAWDLGSGLGVPGIPLAILRKDLSVILVESRRRKAIFLEEVAASLNLQNLLVINSRIESLAELPAFSCLTARAIEQMSSLIPTMFRIGANCSQILFFGSDQLVRIIQENLPGGFDLNKSLLPETNRRFLISLIRST
jgi:16S rRNA (guanine(527)-N(7))-methyltransferase RsmG